MSRLTYHFKQIEQNVTDALLKKYGKPIPEEEIVTDSLKISKLRTTRTEVDESIHYESVQEDGEAHLVTFTSLKHYPEWVEVNRKVKDVISKETADDL